MKYAFIIGSNAFVVPNGVISFTNGEHSKEILRVKSLYDEHTPNSQLLIDLDIEDHEGHHISLRNNVPDQQSYGLTLHKEHNLVRITRPDGRIIINVQQMAEDDAMALEHNTVGELEVNMPVTAIRIFGDFVAEGLHISAENEKLFINKEGYATSALAGNNDLKFSEKGVLL